jgi:hypothetical protein
MPMNIFSGARRTAMVIGIAWVASWLIAGALHKTVVHARYDFVLAKNYTYFAGFDLDCPIKNYQRSFEIETKASQPVQVTICFFGSSKDISEKLVLESIDIKTSTISELEDALLNAYKAGDTQAARLLADEIIRLRQVSKIDFYLLLEAERKGSLPTDKLELLGGARKSGLVPAQLGLSQPAAETFNSEMKILKDEDANFNQKWWSTWRSTYAEGLSVMVGGIVALWIFSLSTGWIVRGFLGIPRGKDQRVEK